MQCKKTAKYDSVVEPNGLTGLSHLCTTSAKGQMQADSSDRKVLLKALVIPWTGALEGRSGLQSEAPPSVGSKAGREAALAPCIHPPQLCEGYRWKVKTSFPKLTHLC